MAYEAPEFSRLISVDRLSAAGTIEDLQAKPAERAALAERFNLVDLEKLEANLTLTPGSRRSVSVTGTVEAALTQRCVVTLELLPIQLKIPVDLVFVPQGDKAQTEELDVDMEEGDVELFEGNKIDLGEAVAQILGINLDPYPRKADAALPASAFQEVEEAPAPLAQLAELLNKKKNADKSKN